MKRWKTKGCSKCVLIKTIKSAENDIKYGSLNHILYGYAINVDFIGNEGAESVGNYEWGKY